MVRRWWIVVAATAVLATAATGQIPEPAGAEETAQQTEAAPDAAPGDKATALFSAIEDPTNSATAQALRGLFPERLHAEHFLLPDYQWICLLAVIFLGFVTDAVVRALLSMATRAWLRYVRADVEQQVQKGLWKPVGLLSQAAVWYLGTTAIGLPRGVLIVLLVALKFFAIVAAVWTAFRVIDLAENYFRRKAQRTTTKFDDLLIPLIGKSLKVLAVCMAVVFFGDMFDLNWTALIGGLGLGGAALALASKDALGNFFGSITVLTDRPFEIGDWVVTSGVEGTVEAVGLRSTRIRTFYNSLITLPNTLLTTAIVDNMGQRRYRRIKETLGVQYDATPEQIDAFCEGIRELIRRHPYTRKDYYHVYLNSFGDSALNVLLYCFVECPDWAIELREKHRLFNDIVRLAQRLGVSFAFPTQTVHLYQGQPVPGEPDQVAAEPLQAGQLQAAEIAGPLQSRSERPGSVEFRGPTDL